MADLVIVIRGLGARWLGCYGNEWIHTPNLDRLAAASEVFDRYYVRKLADPAPPKAPAPLKARLPQQPPSPFQTPSPLTGFEAIRPVVLDLDNLPRQAETLGLPGWLVIDGLQNQLPAAMSAPEALAHFAAAVERLDAALAPLLVWEGSLLLTSDGGCAVGEHGCVGRIGPPHEELVHAPLILRHAKQAHAGYRHLCLCSDADLPSIQSGKLPQRELILSEHQGLHSVRTTYWTLIETPRPGLFRYPHDRFEQCDLARVHPEEVERLSRLLAESA